MGRNNLSRNLAKQFAQMNALKIEEHRSVVDVGDKKFSFCINDHSKKKVSCRQTYEDCSGFISYCPNMKTFKVYVGSPSVGILSRISTRGKKAYNVVIENAILPSVTFKM